MHILHWVCHLVKYLKNKEVKSVAKSRSDFNYDSKYAFFKFYKEFDEFEEMSLDSKYNRMKEFNKLLINFKNLKTRKTETQLIKERFMKTVNEPYKHYYNAYKSDYDTDDELIENKKKKYDYEGFVLGDEINKESKLDEKTKEL